MRIDRNAGRGGGGAGTFRGEGAMLASETISDETLGAVLSQSPDCVKLIGLDGAILWMNPRGQCAMEIDNFDKVKGARWVSLWPAESSAHVAKSLEDAALRGEARFEAFCPTAKGSPRWWNVTVAKILDEAGAHIGYLSISRDVSDEELDRQHLATLAREMRHRLGNVFTVVGSMLGSLARGDVQNEAFASDMQQRLSALATTQLVFAEEGAVGNLATLSAGLLAPFNLPGVRISIGAAPSLELTRTESDAIALALAELGVNSMKHGALANGGAIGVAFRVEDGVVVIDWDESRDRSSAAPAPAPGTGQGLGLIRRLLTAQGGSLDTDWRENALTARIRLPVAAA